MRVLRALLPLAFLLAAPLAACGFEATPSSAAPEDPELQAMFEQLKTARSAAEAAMVEERIWQAWSRSPSATVDVLMERANAAEAEGEQALARRFVDEAVRLMPAYAGGWYRRSVLRYGSEDRAGAINDIHETLEREPRHFGAWAGLGVIYEDMGQEEAALKAYRKALDIHPFLETARQGARRLEPKVEGVEL